MKNQTGLIILIVLCVGMAIALVWSQQHLKTQETKYVQQIDSSSNKLVEATVTLDQQRKVNTTLEDDLKKQRNAYSNLTNAYTTTVGALEKTQTTLKETKAEMAREIAQRDSKIADLESQNQMLDQRAAELSLAITNLTTQIAETKSKLSASEGDKAFLEKELHRMMTEKAELERQFNDISVLRAQVAKLKEELAVSKRLEWMRQGLFAKQDQKGGQQLVQKTPLATNRPSAPRFDLNVEVSADGSVRVLPSPDRSSVPTNAPASR